MALKFSSSCLHLSHLYFHNSEFVFLFVNFLEYRLKSVSRAFELYTYCCWNYCIKDPTKVFQSKSNSETLSSQHCFSSGRLDWHVNHGDTNHGGPGWFSWFWGWNWRATYYTKWVRSVKTNIVFLTSVERRYTHPPPHKHTRRDTSWGSWSERMGKNRGRQERVQESRQSQSTWWFWF